MIDEFQIEKSLRVATRWISERVTRVALRLVLSLMYFSSVARGTFSYIKQALQQHNITIYLSCENEFILLLVQEKSRITMFTKSAYFLLIIILMTARQQECTPEQKNQLFAQMNKFRYSHLDLCFSYSKSKPKQTKIFTPVTTPSKQNKDNLNFEHPKFRMSCRLNRKNETFQDSSSTSFFKTAKAKSPKHENTEQATQSSEIPYIGWAFPQRKKKSGDQQFLKLLMKYSDNLLLANSFKEKHNMDGLFQANPEKIKPLKPKLKAKVRLNWVKDRYCVNRDKEGDLMDYSVPQISPKQSNMPNLPNFSSSLTKRQHR